MGLSRSQIEAIALSLYEAEQRRVPIPPVSATHPAADAEDAYAIQVEIIRLRQAAAPSVLAGWKVGLTSKAMQQMLDVYEPDFGHLLESMRLEDGCTLEPSEYIWPRVEPEVAFILKSDIEGPGVTESQVLAATEYLAPALEIIDSRIKDWKIRLVDTVADNASCGRFVLGAGRVRPADVDPRLIAMNFYSDGALVSTATSAAVMGNPAASVAWLANKLSTLDQWLQAGQVVMPGSLVAAVDAKPGRVVRAEFSQLGPVEVRVR